MHVSPRRKGPPGRRGVHWERKTAEIRIIPSKTVNVLSEKEGPSIRGGSSSKKRMRTEERIISPTMKIFLCKEEELGCPCCSSAN
jgi:hypothetical protein